ncbi:MAG: di-trans,poly-cis-decaprenylcistransferase, partial [Clostridia bacterium]|nr:di-trans,poly-cis-decaprenylcistransferase [Clostridia bacterium]
FSTENWKRPKHEVDEILRLLERYLDESIRDREKNAVHITFLGDTSVFSSAFREKMRKTEELTREYPNTVNIALNYGGRAELVHAFEVLRRADPGEITEDDITNALYTSHLPPVDLIVRTGGDLRLSNFLLWQAAYAELYFTDTLWPDFDTEDVDRAIEAFYSRKRRYGGL